MKYLLFLLACMAISFQLIAQSENADEDNTSDVRDRLVFEFNWCGWMDVPDNIETKWYSRGINIYTYLDLPLGNSPLSVAPGLGLGIDNVYHNGRFLATDTGISLMPIPDTIAFKNNKLNTVYLDIPLELRFRTNPNANGKSFKIAVGVKGGILLASKVKYKGKGAAFGWKQDQVKYKQFKVPYLDNLRYGLTFRVGYGVFNAQMFYGLSTLFESGLGPQMAPITIGLSFNAL